MNFPMRNPARSLARPGGIVGGLRAALLDVRAYGLSSAVAALLRDLRHDFRH
jgi:hypothetical protein